LAEDETRDRRAQYAYLDLLATTLTEHEKTLNRLIDRLEKLSKNLARLGQPPEIEEQPEPEAHVAKTDETETLTYIKIKLNRSTRELKDILESLKD